MNEAARREANLALVRECLARLAARDVPRWLELFADDGAFESGFGGTRVEGPAAIEARVAGVLGEMDGLEFHDIVLTPMLDAGLVLAEYKGSATITSTGKPYIQAYASVFGLRDGKVVLFREYPNVQVLREAFTPS